MIAVVSFMLAASPASADVPACKAAWSVAVPDVGGSAIEPGDQGALYFRAGSQLVAVRDGKVLWRKPVHKPDGRFRVVPLGERVLVVTRAAVDAHAASNGAIAWSRVLPAAQHTMNPLRLGDRVIVGLRIWPSTRLIAFGADGGTAWDTVLDGGVHEMVVEDDHLLAFDESGCHALGADGKQLSGEPRPTTMLGCSGSYASDRERLVCATYDCLPCECPAGGPCNLPPPTFKIDAFSADGGLRWHLDVPREMSDPLGPVRLAPDGSALVAVNPVLSITPDGVATPLCRLALDDAPHVFVGDTLVVTNGDQTLRALKLPKPKKAP